MPPFTAIALDRLLDPGAAKSMAAVKDVPDPRLERRNSSPVSRLDRGNRVPPLRLEKKTSLPIWKKENKNQPPAKTVDRNNHFTQISPALYATPKPTPIPDSPSSYPPSPYVINHKRRGPRLLKSLSEDNVSTSPRAMDEQKEGEGAKNPETEVGILDSSSMVRGASVDSKKVNHLTSADHAPVKKELANGTLHCVKDEQSDVNDTFVPVEEQAHVSYTLDKQEHADDSCIGESQGHEMTSGSVGGRDTGKTVLFNLQQIGDTDDFSDPLDSMSLRSNTESYVKNGLERSKSLTDPQDSMSLRSNAEGNGKGGLERSLSLTTPLAEFFDAWEELSSENGPQPPPVPDIEAELREMRLSFLMEIEKRKQAEETLNNMRTQWLRIQRQLSSVGLTLPSYPFVVAENEQLDDPADDLTQQVYLARFVSNSIGRGLAKAEVEMEMEAQLELKNFEITRLWDRLHYYEAVNREMSHRNQEVVDTARRLRQKRKRRQRWIWGSIVSAITLGSAVLAWSYLSTGKGTSSSNQSHSSEGDHASQQ